MNKAWQVLVVDDEPDVHAVTKLALQNKHWRGRKVRLVCADSAATAKELLAGRPPGFFDLALVDVVMEEEDSGLKLCEHIRSNQPRSLRIILRTGQPGAAPEEEVLNHYDIDHYLAKSEMTSENLYRTIRSGLRVSQDIRTLCEMGAQLDGFAKIFLNETPDRQLEAITECMQPVIDLLAAKTSADVTLFADGTDKRARVVASEATTPEDKEVKRRLLIQANSEGATELVLHKLSDHDFVMPLQLVETEIEEPSKGFLSRLTSIFTANGADASDGFVGGFVIRFAGDDNSPVPSYLLRSLEDDARLFLENWRTAYRTTLMGEALLQSMMKL